MKSEISRILEEAKPYKKTLTIVAIAGIVYAASSAIILKQLKFLIDALTSKNVNGALNIGAVILLLALAVAVGRYFHIFLMNYVAECITQNIRQKLQRKFMKLNLSFHNTYSAGSGGLISRILNDVVAIQNGLRMVADIFSSPLLLVALLTNLFLENWRLTLGLLLILPVIGVFQKNISRSLRKYLPLGQETLEKMTATIKESLDGVRVIQSFNLEDVMGKKLVTESQGYLEIRKKIHSRVEIMGPVSELVATLLILGILLYISIEISNGRATMGSFVSFVSSLIAINMPIKKFQESYVRIQEVIVSSQRVYSIIDDPNVVHESEKNLPFPQDWKQITYKNVSFTYGKDMILKNINLTINRGEQIALVGESGSGKSTIVNLLERFFDATSGEILIDGVNILDINLQDLRKNIALVNQDVFLFSDSIERNIQAGDFERPLTDVPSMAKMANANDFIMRMPHGYQSMVGDRGNLLSGGEKQRISIARALFKNAPILILDEATSALDTASEIEVQKGLDHLMEGRTALIIAHRLSTIQSSNKIVILKAGQIVEIGTHQQLLDSKGEYHRFYTLQHRI
ncbi:ABC transporter ATP-binding protein [Bdellovibrio sp. HCB337]|uniref:ABC transporter ATP-binding protein n=1 Tax=Bdellovibrio sp. HCB337 TaxID=3394358 RepID=UPI0039A6845A